MPRSLLRGAALACALAGPALGQASRHALRFHGTGSNQQDRLRIQVDDDAGGPDQSAPCDVGQGSFTIELWLRGKLADNPTANAGGDLVTNDESWRTGNVLVDRDVAGGTLREFGISIAGGLVRFGTGRGDWGPDQPHTIEGSSPVLDEAWHHVACVRDAAAGTLAVYVDGALDFASPPGLSSADLSYPDHGVAGQSTPWGPYLVIGAEKHDVGPASPSFAGYVDELRVWTTARQQSQIALYRYYARDVGEPGLAGNWRFEEGAGTSAADSSGTGSPAGLLIAGVPGNGEWTDADLDPKSVAPVIASPLPPGFSRETLLAGLTQPSALAVLPDGRILFAELDGTVRVVAGGALLPQPLVQIPASMNLGSSGLLALEPDPAFGANGFLYVYYTTTEPRNRLSRFTVVGNTASPATELVLWQNADLATDDHHGGGVAFGADGNVYIATGDQFVSANSQNLSVEHGKLLRIRPDGSIPPDNPFVGVAGARPAIYARGLRNPYRLSADLATGSLWIGDVGGNGLSSWEELDRAAPAANFGWPWQEGEACNAPSCSIFTGAAWSYRHDDPAYFLGQSQGCITAGPVYRGALFPPEYQGCLFAGDYANRWIRRLVFDASGAVVADPLFMTSPKAGTVVDLEVGPDGALYYITFREVTAGGGPTTGALYRITFAQNGNLAPVPVASATPAQGQPPLAVQLTGQGSFDPDQGPSALGYAWDFGDGGSSTAASPQHVFAQPGLYQAKLTVDDGAASAVSDPLSIAVGNAPSVTIASPAQGMAYAAGQVISLSGSAVDVEDGAIPPSGLTWYVQLVHAGHHHPFYGPVQGVAQTSFQVPVTGHTPDETYFEIQLSAEDSHGLKTTVSHSIAPLIAPVELRTFPVAIPVFVQGQGTATPVDYQSLQGFQLEVEAQRSFAVGNQILVFRRWTDGGARKHLYSTPPGASSLMAVYSPAVAKTVAAKVAAADRMAEHSAATGQAFASPGNPFLVTLGRTSAGPVQMGLELALPVPREALILSAKVRLVAGSSLSGSPVADVWAYDTQDAPRFLAGSPTPLMAWAPLTSADVLWVMPQFIPGQVQESPDLAAVVQEVVDRPDWSSGNFLGLVLDPSATAGLAWCSAANFASGQAPELVVVYAEAFKHPPAPAFKK